MVTQRTSQNCPLIRGFRHDDAAHNRHGAAGVVGDAILGPTQENVAGSRSLDARKELAVRREE
jgi:hypothetical protein